MNVNQVVINQTTYTCPLAFLPALSVIPVVNDGVHQEQGEEERLSVALQRVVAEATHTAQRWRQGMVAASWVAQDLAQLAQTLDQFVAPPAGYATQNLDPQQMAHSDMSRVMAEACHIYDRYFQVQRVHPMRFDHFVGQVAATARHLLHDLPYTLLDRAQLTQIVQTIGLMGVTLHSKLPPNARVAQSAVTSQQSPSHPVTLSPYEEAWQHETASTPAWTEQVAHYRWKVGHHFFDLCAIFCADALQLASCVLEEDADDKQAIASATTYVQQAESFLRGTTAAMWYAGDFPAQTYQQIIRPSMVMPGAHAGFSGDQNADYNRMKQVKRQLKKQLRTRYGNQLAIMPANLANAFRSFHEADIQDNEHHLLIAAHKVGADQSLAQKEWQAELPDLAHKQTAIDILREMAEQKRREFQVQ